MEEKKQASFWWQSWFKPREVVQAVCDRNPSYGLKRLSWLVGMVSVLNTARALQLGYNYSAITLLIAAAILALPLGYVWLQIYSYFFYISGKWLKGSANFSQVVAAVMWSLPPTILILISQLILIAFYGTYVFSNQIVDLANPLLYQFCSFLGLIGSVWQLVLMIIMMSQVQKYSVWKAIGNTIIVVVIWIILLFIVGFIIYGLAQLNSPKS